MDINILQRTEGASCCSLCVVKEGCSKACPLDPARCGRNYCEGCDDIPKIPSSVEEILEMILDAMDDAVEGCSGDLDTPYEFLDNAWIQQEGNTATIKTSIGNYRLTLTKEE